MRLVCFERGSLPAGLQRTAAALGRVPMQRAHCCVRAPDGDGVRETTTTATHAQVTLTPGSPLHDAYLLNLRYMLSLTTDDMLLTFRQNAGLPAPGPARGVADCKSNAGVARTRARSAAFEKPAAHALTHAPPPASGVPYTDSWEDPVCEVRGQFMGHYLSALAYLVKHTGARVRVRASVCVHVCVCVCARARGRTAAAARRAREPPASHVHTHAHGSLARTAAGEKRMQWVDHAL